MPPFSSQIQIAKSQIPHRILIIRLSALGDLTLCFQAFQDIRAAHPDARIALLTMPAFAGFARQMPWFDEVLVDDRSPLSNLASWWRLLASIRCFAPHRIYDLQGKKRQSILYYALGGPLWGPQWSGAASGCSHPRLWPPLPGMHFTDFIAAQLQRAGLQTGTPLDLSWLDADVSRFVPLEHADSPPLEGGVRGGGVRPFIVIIPGCAPQHLHKRWPAANYAALAQHFSQQGYAVLAVGTQQDADAIAAIRQIAPQVIDLGGQTSLLELAGLARCAAYVIGNDTGPTHLAAAVGARTLALLSDRVDPAWSAPKGPYARWLQGRPLAGLCLNQVLSEM
jgi:ADP-heptose:LPS heptosyltransferase